MVKSMTGYAATGCEFTSDAEQYVCQWDMRSVNGRGLDLRLRIPDWLEGLEIAIRKQMAETIKRGNVTLSLKLSRIDQSSGMRLNAEALDAAVSMIMAAETRAESQGLGLAPMTAADLLSMRGVVDVGPEVAVPQSLVADLLAQATPLIDAFNANRAAEGAAMAALLNAQIDRIASLTAQALVAIDARRADQAAALKAAVARLYDAAPQLEPARLEQELALLAVKTDVTEEIDRLTAHVEATRVLLAESNPIGRKLDFLMQEFNREANTLCAKSQSPELTRIGLDLKTVIDQMREQVQNLE